MGVIMKIMSFNLKDSIFDNLTFRWLYRYKKILKYILSVNPDIIGTQELTHSGRRYLMKRLTNYNIYGDSRKSNIFNDEYNSIIIKRSYKVKKFSTYSLSDDRDRLGTRGEADNFPRICVVVHCEKNGTKYLIVNTHIDNSKDRSNRRRLLTIVNDIIKEEKARDELLIVTGDFNMTLNNNIEKFVINNKLINVFEDYKKSTFPSRPEMRMIDYIMVDKKLKVKSYSVGDCNMSDHLPIICNLIR